MAGYWPCFLCVFMDIEGVEEHKHAKKGRPRPIALVGRICRDIKTISLK